MIYYLSQSARGFLPISDPFYEIVTHVAQGDFWQFVRPKIWSGHLCMTIRECLISLKASLTAEADLRSGAVMMNEENDRIALKAKNCIHLFID